MHRLLVALLLGLVGAGIVHIAVLLALPHLTDRDAWSRLTAIAELYEPVQLQGPGRAERLMPGIDPLFGAVACRFDLEDGPLHVRGQSNIPYWSISVYDRNGQNVFSFNDRTAADSRVDFVVLTGAQTLGLRQNIPDAYLEAIFVEADLDEGIVLVRAFIPDASWEPVIGDFLDEISCTAGG